jgi:PPM family protein phosphatase
LDSLSGLIRPGAVKPPAGEEVDVFGLTHPGLVRTENQDQFLVASIYEEMEVHFTSLPHLPSKQPVGDRRAGVGLVADGVGGVRGDGSAASRLVVEATTRYVRECVDALYATTASKERDFVAELTGAALRAHAHLLDAQEADPSLGILATTLTLFIGVWPRTFLVQVGDSRYYTLEDGKLSQISRDQTVAQELVDSGALNPEQAARSRWAHALSSSVGGSESKPVVTVLDNDWNMVHLICSDGLTKHVTDEQIRDRLMSMTSARQACEDLLQDALEAGGTDNITLIVGRATPKDDG